MTCMIHEYGPIQDLTKWWAVRRAHMRHPTAAMRYPCDSTPRLTSPGVLRCGLDPQQRSIRVVVALRTGAWRIAKITGIFAAVRNYSVLGDVSRLCAESRDRRAVAGAYDLSSWSKPSGICFTRTSPSLAISPGWRSSG